MPFWTISAASALLLAGLAVLLYVRRPPAPLWPIALACQIFALLWVVGDLWASHSTSMTEKRFALAVLFTGAIALPPLWWETCRRYIVWQGLELRWIRHPLVKLPLWFAAVAWVFMITGPWHGQFIEPVIGGRNEYAWGVKSVSYAHWAISLATCALCSFAAFRHQSSDVRRRMAILAGATLAPVATSLLHVYGRGMPREDTVAIGLGLTSAVTIYGVIFRRLFNLVPVGLKQILQTDPSGVLLLGRGGRLLTWNPAAEKLLEGIHLEPDLSILPVLAEALEDGETGEGVEYGYELSELLSATTGSAGSATFRYRAGGSERWLRFRATPISARRRSIAAVCVRIEDVSREERNLRERRIRKERLQRREAAATVQVVADGVAHDFNNVLVAIDGRTRMALDDAAEGRPVRQHLEAIAHASALAKDLTSQLRGLSGNEPAKPRNVDLSRLIEDMRELLSDSLPSNAMLYTQLARRLPFVSGDATGLCQVVLNLVKNAGEAIGDEPGEIVVSTSRVRIQAEEAEQADEAVEIRPRPGNYVRLEVADNGSGMDEPELCRVFDHCFSTRHESRGLGLSIVRRIVESHGGIVTVESRADAGTRFHVWLPVHTR